MARRGCPRVNDNRWGKFLPLGRIGTVLSVPPAWRQPTARCPKALRCPHLRGCLGRFYGRGKNPPIFQPPRVSAEGAAGTVPRPLVPPPCSRGRQSSTAAAGMRAVPRAGTGSKRRGLASAGSREYPSCRAPGLDAAPRRCTGSCMGEARSVALEKRDG